MTDFEVDIPSDARIKSCLREAVRHALDHGEEVTVNSARAHVESKLELPSNFLKDSPKWKAASKDIITAVVEGAEAQEDARVTKPITKTGSKRKSEEPHKIAKKPKKQQTKRKTSESESDVLSDVPSRLNSTPPRRQSRTSSTAELPVEDNGIKNDQSNVDNADAKPGDESEFSDVIDEPQPKKKRTTEVERKTKGSKSKPEKAGTADQELPADEQEIKRLQSWLLKCGIRKLWHRELAAYNSSGEKIRHLKSMLADIGMTGRFSAEKARSIKEARELASEIEAAKEFNEQWGHDADGNDSEVDTTQGKTDAGTAVRRARPKGLVDLSDSDDDV